MKILHTVQFYDPSSGGMQEVVKQISENLVKRGHRVTVATSCDPARKSCSINGVTIREFDLSGNSVTGITGDVQAYQEFLLHSDFDIITNFASQIWTTDLMLPLLMDISSKKVFVPTGFSALHMPEYADYFKKMKEWMKHYDMNVFLSESYQDYEFARMAGIKNTIVIPNGASAEEFLSPEKSEVRHELNIPKNHLLILHVGSHTGLKGHTEAIKIFERAHLNHATFIIVGNVFSPVCFWSCKLRELLFMLNPWNQMNDRRLLIRSLPRKKTIALYKTADLFLFPSRIECSPLVLFECMASKTPFLTTDVGNAREIIECSHSGILLPTQKNSMGYARAEIRESAAILETIGNDKEKRIRMGEAGYHMWTERFNWEKISQSYELVYTDLVLSVFHDHY